MNRVALLALGSLAILVSGCAGVISRQVREEATPLRSFAELRSDPQAFLGKVVILGGDIVETDNRPDGTTIIVLQKPLGRDERPRIQDASGGRFIVRFSEYLDPAVFAPHRRVTVAGVVEGTEERPVGEAPYRYVVLQGKEIHLLREPEPRPYLYGPFSPYYWYGPPYPYWYDPFWGRRPWWH